MNNKRVAFLIIGVIMLFNAVIVNGTFIINGRFPDGLMTIALTIMSFGLAYLAPHFTEKDECAQKIRERAIYISYFWCVSYVIILMLIFKPTSNIDLIFFHTLTIFAVLYISTVFLNMVYYAKKY